MPSKRIIAITLLSTFLCASLAISEEKKSMADTITIPELRNHMFFLASDELEGRYTGSRGFDLAVQYASSQFRRSGLKPVLIDENGKPTFVQKFILDRRGIKEIKPLVVVAGGEKTQFKYGDSFKILSATNLVEKDTKVVFVGYGISEPDHGWDDLKGLDLTGKTAVMLPDAPMKDGKPVLPKGVHSKYASQRGNFQKIREISEHGAATVILVPNAQIMGFWNMISANPRRTSYSLPRPGEAEERPGRSNMLLVKNEVIEAVFAGQDYSPSDIKEKGLEGYKTYELADALIDFSFEADRGEGYSCNVVGMVEGNDPELKDQYITVGAHLDHVGPQRGQVSNGADDNASGSVGVLEVAEAIALSHPRRSVIFILYGSEEIGLIGSKYFIDNCPVPVDDIDVNINMDMIGRTDARSKETRAHYVVGSDRTNPELKDILKSVNKRTVGWPLDFEGGERYFRQSDHYNYHEQGIPVVFFFSGAHRDLHRPTDDAEIIEYDKMQKIAQLVYELTLELSDRDKSLRDHVNKKDLD